MEDLRSLVLERLDLKRNKVVRWRCADLCAEIASRWSVTANERTVCKLLRRLRMTRLQSRPYHPTKNAAAQEAFKKLRWLCNRGAVGLGCRQGDRGVVPKPALGLSCPVSMVPDVKFHPGLFFRSRPLMQACAVVGGLRTTVYHGVIRVLVTARP